VPCFQIFTGNLGPSRQGSRMNLYAVSTAEKRTKGVEHGGGYCFLGPILN